MSDPTDEEFRDVGYKGAARDYPMDEFAVALMAAFNGVTAEQLVEAMKYHPNANTKAAWERVANASKLHVLKAMREPSDGMVEPAEQWLNGDEQEFHNKGDGSGYWVPRSVSVWERMIDAAIAEAERT
jgi:hypothetical protein